MRRGAAWLACRAPPVDKDRPPSDSQYYDEIEDEHAEDEDDEEETPVNRTKKLRSAVQRSAAPGRIADYYEFRKTLGAFSRHTLAYERNAQAAGERVGGGWVRRARRAHARPNCPPPDLPPRRLRLRCLPLHARTPPPVRCSV